MLCYIASVISMPGPISCTFGSTTSGHYNLKDMNIIVPVPWAAVFVSCTSKF